MVLSRVDEVYSDWPPLTTTVTVVYRRSAAKVSG